MIKLLGTLIDQQLTHAPQLRAMALKARQRTGFARRASRYLDGNCNAGVYKAFVRPNLEYAHLAWMGAAPSNLGLLDEVQQAAEKLIGPDGPILDTLDHRRRVGALSYLYKLQCWDAPPRMQAMIPPRLPRPPLGRTRASRAEYESWHPHNLRSPLIIGVLIMRCAPFLSVLSTLGTHCLHGSSTPASTSKIYKRSRSGFINFSVAKQ